VAEVEAFGLTDKSGEILELRRLDGELFPSGGTLSQRKSHAVKGSNKKWPVGIQEAESYNNLILVEGVPDFLGAFQIIQVEGKAGLFAPVGMLSAGSSIDSQALPLFEGKHVRIVPHVDQAGLKAAKSWAESLKLAKAKKVDFIDLSSFNVTGSTCPPLKDLCDFLPRHKDGFQVDAKKWEVLS